VSGSLANKSVAPRIPLTVDLTLHMLRPLDGPRVTMTARTLKVGRTTTVAETLFFSGSDPLSGSIPGDTEPVAVSHTTFMVSPRPEDVMEEVFWHRPPTPARMSAPIMEQIGAVVLGPGIVELARVPYVMQPSGTVQGGAVALIAELAASTALGAGVLGAGVLGAGVLGNPVTNLEIRYVSAVRVGPARTSATILGPGVARVEVRDAGNEDRLTALVIARASAGA
jgi:acyl-coenzyme A thioesterase PaaI-like protein